MNAADPLYIARRMMTKGSDPGLIAAYLAEELRRDPTLGMTPLERAMHQINEAFAAFKAAFRAIPAPKRSDFGLVR